MPTRPEEIWRYYDRATASFEITSTLFDRPEIAPLIPPASDFFALTPVELSEVLREMAEELDLEVSLALVASFEAILREDFLLRTSEAGNGILNVRLAALRDRLGERTALEDLLDVWKEAYPDAGKAVGEFKQVVQFRHWLAHGRQGYQKGFAGFDPWVVRRRASAVQSSIPDIPMLVDWES